MKSADTSTQPLTVAQRWDLHCAIVERYVREYKTLPERGVAYFNVNIGNWLAAQRELATLGLLSSTHQQRINNLDILLAEMNPTSLSDLLEPFRRPAPRPAKTHSAPKLRPVPRKKPAPTIRDADIVPVPLHEELAVDAPTDPLDVAVDLEDSVPDPAPETTEETAAMDTKNAVDEPVTPPESDDPVPAAVEPEPEPEPSTESVSPLAERAAAVTEFYEIHRRLPKRQESGIRAGGASITWWTWGLVPAYADGTLDAETLDTLAVEPWWHLVIERANKLKAKRLSETTESPEPAPADAEPETPAPADAEPETPEPAPASIPKVRDPDAAARRKRTVPHRRNPLAAESRSEKEAAKAEEDGKVLLTDLPEAGLVRLRTFDEASGTYIRANRRVSSDTAPRSMRNLSLSGIPFHAVRSKDGGGEHVIHVVLHVKSVYDALPALEALGYTYTEVSSEPLAVIAQ